MSNTVARLFTEKLGAATASSFIGSAGEIFYDPADGVLRLSNGIIPGGIIMASGSGGGGISNDPTKVAKVGDTMFGPLVLPADPTLPLQAATKQYVDNTVALKAALVHTHDDRYYTEAEIDTKLTLYSLTTHNHTLNSLTNVSVSSLTNDQYLKWNGLAWINATLPASGPAGATSLNDLTDVQILGEGPDDFQVISWSPSENVWTNIHIGNLYPNLAQVKDVMIGDPVDGEYLKYDSSSSKWVNGPGPYLYDRMFFDTTNNTLGLRFSEEMSPTLTADLSSLVGGGGPASSVLVSTDYPENPVNGSVFISDDTDTLYYYINGAWKLVDQVDYNLGDNYDVETTGATNGQVLTYVSANNTWIPATPSSGGVNRLSLLLDTQITSPSSRQFLIHDGDNWVNRSVGINTGDLSDVNSNVTPANGHVLTWNGTLNVWEAKAPAAGSSTPEAAKAMVTMSTNAINLSTAAYFKKTITGPTTFTVTGAPAAGTVGSFMVELVNPASNITWFSGIKWAGGVVPALTATGTDVLGFTTYDGGVTFIGVLVSKAIA